MQEVLPFCGKLDGSILEWLLKPDVLFLTGRFARDMESAWVVIDRRLFTVQESQWREFKIDSNEIVSSKFVSSLILIFFSFNLSLPRKPIMNPFLLVLTFKFAYSLLNLLFIYYLHILVILQLAVMYFNTEWSKICPVLNIQINFWFLFYAQNNLILVFFSNVLFSNISIWNKVVFFFHLPYF